MHTQSSQNRRRNDGPMGLFAKRCARVWDRLRQCPDTEFEQNIVRAVILLTVLIYAAVWSLTVGAFIPSFFAIAGSWMLYVILIFIWINISPVKSELRRVLHTVGDRGMITWALLVYGQWTSPLYVLYVWNDIGNAARYGRHYLYLSSPCSVLGFGIVILFSGYWHALTPLNIGLLIGILLAPLYALLFFRRLTVVNNRLQDLATRDTLTGLPNRAFLYERLREAIAAAERHGREFTVMFVDIDNFKRINDTDGHEAGDEALQATARALRDSLRKADVVARLGGDEFVVLLHDVRGKDLAVADNLRDALAAYTPSRLRACIGVATYPHCGTDAETLVRHADHAMYEAKRAGKNRSHACPDSLRRLVRSAHE